MRIGCAEEGSGGCFNGGLIDDISAPNRVIMTASNETWYCYADQDDDGFSEWSEAFMDALHGEDMNFTDQLVHTGIEVDADANNDGKVSMWGAWTCAWDHDDARLSGLETPWLDDNGNGLPTYVDGHDVLDPADGELASETFLTATEPSLVTVLNELGFTNIEESATETFGPRRYEVRLYAEFAGYHEFNNLSWYPVGTADYNLIFSGTEGGFGYVEPPITKTFTAYDEFGLAFQSPEAIHFTETAKNPDGLKHAQVYANLDNPNMYLIGFENLYGVEAGDYNDMVISLENVNSPPNTPSKPSGPTSGYYYQSYSYSTNTTDPDGDDIYYQFDWGDGSTTTIGPYPSGTTASASHTWELCGIFPVKVIAQDSYGTWSNWSPSLAVDIHGGGTCPTLFVWNGSA